MDYKMLIYFLVFHIFSIHSFAEIRLDENRKNSFIYQNNKGHIQKIILSGYTLPENVSTYLETSFMITPILNPARNKKRQWKNIKIIKDHKLKDVEIVSIELIRLLPLYCNHFDSRAFIIETTTGIFLKICFKGTISDNLPYSLWSDMLDYFAWITLRVDDELNPCILNRGARELKLFLPGKFDKTVFFEDIDLQCGYIVLESKCFDNSQATSVNEPVAAQSRQEYR